MCPGGIAAGVVSDYSGGRATTCCAMLLLAAPMVRMVAGRNSVTKRQPDIDSIQALGLGLSHCTASYM